MFYKMIEAKRNEWLASETCTVKAVIDYIVKTGQMRDAQVEAIKTYLFLKIACSCKPLAELFYEGAFNTLDLDDSEVSHSTREYLKVNKAAAALFEYACLTNDAGEQVSPKLEQQIRKALSFSLSKARIMMITKFIILRFCHLTSDAYWIRLVRRKPSR